MAPRLTRVGTMTAWLASSAVQSIAQDGGQTRGQELFGGSCLPLLCAIDPSKQVQDLLDAMLRAWLFLLTE